MNRRPYQIGETFATVQHDHSVLEEWYAFTFQHGVDRHDAWHGPYRSRRKAEAVAERLRAR